MPNEIFQKYLQVVKGTKGIYKFEYNDQHISPKDFQEMDRELFLNYHISLMEKNPGSFIHHTHKGEINFSHRHVKEIDALIKYLRIFWDSKVLILNNCNLTDQHL